MIINLSRIDFGGITGGKSKPEEVFDVQPTTADQTITPTEGSVFSGGTVRAVTSSIDVNIVSDNIKEGVTILGVAGSHKGEKPEESFNVQPTTSEQTITPTAGSVFSGGTVHAVTSSIDSNIQPENIKEGVSILGVAGTLSEGITPAGTIAINLNGTYDVTNYASAEVNVGDTPDYRYMKGTVDRAGLKAIGWTDEDILTYEQNTTPHYTWQNDQYIVSEENKALYLLDDPNPDSYKNDPNISYVPNKNMEKYFTGSYDRFAEFKFIKGIPFYDISSKTNLTSFFHMCYNLVTIPLLNTSKVTSTRDMFYDCTNLISIPQLDTSKVTDAREMFLRCKSLTTIPLLNTSKVTQMSSMFSGCINLKNIPLLDTSNVTDMDQMFSGCSSLTTIPLLNTSKVTRMDSMFSSCSKLTTIPLLNTSNVTNMQDMFMSCTSLTTIPLLDTSNVTTMYRMFDGCSKLTTIPLLNTSNVTSMESMFYSCSELTTIPQLDTSKMTNMRFTFYSCSELTTIPQLDTSKVTDMYGTFNYCNKLTAVEGIDFSALKSNPSLFGYPYDVPSITRFIVNGKINVSMGENSIKALSAIDYDSVKSILAAADRTDNTDAKTLTFNRTMTDRNGELAALVASCTTKGWTIAGLTLQ